MSTDDKYFADRESEETARVILSKADAWFHGLDVNGYLDKLREAWASYYGAYYTDTANGHRITFSGEQGEYANIAVNHYRNICEHIHVMVTASRPAMQARAVNTDYKSLVQTKLANGLLDYYMREKNLEDYFSRAIEEAIVLGQGFLKMEWNSTAGAVYDFNEETQTPIYEGDIEFTNLSMFNVVFDSTKEDPSQNEWVVCRSFKNRFDLAAKFPEQRDAILKMETKDEQERYDFVNSTYEKTDDIAIYEFYHKRTEAMPDGRYILFCDHDVVLMDAPMPYRELPVYRVSPYNILGTQYGYTNTFDLLPIQTALNSVYSTILTNHNGFGVQNIMAPRQSDVNIEQVSSGMNFIEYNAAAGKPESLNLLNTSPETYKFAEMLEKVMETLSGISSVTRGNPEKNLESGTALALVQSMSLQFVSGLQRSYVGMIEKVGTGIINMLRDYANVPRVAMIVGEANRTYMKQFTGDDLANVNRVVVDLGNPLSKTAAGRVEMAQQLMQMNLIKTPEQYINVINTGNLETMTDGIDRQLMLVKSENEAIVDGELPTAVFTEPHSLHIREHRDILSDPELKNDPELVARVQEHIQQHIDLLRQTDPDTLMMLGEQPLAPPGGSPANQPTPDQMVNQSAMGEPLPPPPAPSNVPADALGVDLPEPASPPGEFENLPTDPSQMIPEG